MAMFLVQCFDTTRTYTPPEKGILSDIASLNLLEVLAEDPLEYATGYVNAIRGTTPLDQGRDYRAGYRLGVNVREGRMKMPPWSNLRGVL